MSGAGTMVGIANFGITALSDYGDAPAAYNSNLAHHVVTNKKWLFLGENVNTESAAHVSSDALGDQYDDGVFVMLHGRKTALQDATLAVGTEYTFLVKTNGTLFHKGHLGAWIGYSNTGVLGTITPVANALNLQPNLTDSMITFNYTIPASTTITDQNNMRLLCVFVSAKKTIYYPRILTPIRAWASTAKWRTTASIYNALLCNWKISMQQYKIISL
ncbi:hypothetical protein FACS189414_1920 [Bacteroidia bacterium]|nr:hypothetical protein FACS189414_1920 [Bacteroidia bacterium]